MLWSCLSKTCSQSGKILLPSSYPTVSTCPFSNFSRFPTSEVMDVTSTLARTQYCLLVDLQVTKNHVLWACSFRFRWLSLETDISEGREMVRETSLTWFPHPFLLASCRQNFSPSLVGLLPVSAIGHSWGLETRNCLFLHQQHLSVLLVNKLKPS